MTIGTQVWMVENLKTTKYRDGTSIPNVIDNTTWSNLTSPSYCWYNNDVTNKNIYGALYNWYTANIDQLCPTGWHVPSDAEWTILISYLGGESIAGDKLKEAGTTHWQSPNTGTNESGFTALPGGVRSNSGIIGLPVGGYGRFWSATEFNATSAGYLIMNFDAIKVNQTSNLKNFGFSIRCIKD